MTWTPPSNALKIAPHMIIFNIVTILSSSELLVSGTHTNLITPYHGVHPTNSTKKIGQGALETSRD